jgi:hypothetical protein
LDSVCTPSPIQANSTKAEAHVTDCEYVAPSQLRPGPIRHKSLPPKLLEHIEAVFEVIGPYLNTTLEEFEIGFMRDKHPEQEVAVWCGITSAWIAYHEKYHGGDVLPNEDEQKLVAALVAISTGVEDTAMLGVPVDVGQKWRSTSCTEIVRDHPARSLSRWCGQFHKPRLPPGLGPGA